MINLPRWGTGTTTESDFKRQFTSIVRKTRYNPNTDEKDVLGLIPDGRDEQGKKVFKVAYGKSKFFWQIVEAAPQTKIKIFALPKEVIQQGIIDTLEAYKEKYYNIAVELVENGRLNEQAAQVFVEKVKNIKEGETIVLPIDLP